MSRNELNNLLGAECQPVADGVVYASSALVMPFYGNAIGGYIQELGNNRVRISDNADTLFEAVTHGVEHSISKVERIKDTVRRFGVEFTEAGEIAVICRADELDYFFTRFVEASFAVASITLDWHPATQTVGAFRQKIGSVLVRKYRERLEKNVKVMGSSGHQLTFHFVVDAEQQQEQLIQTLALSSGVVDWNNVYSTLGKMIDVSRVRDSRRIVIIESMDDEELVRASTLLSEKAKVIPFIDADRLCNVLAA